MMSTIAAIIKKITLSGNAQVVIKDIILAIPKEISIYKTSISEVPAEYVINPLQSRMIRIDSSPPAGETE